MKVVIPENISEIKLKQYLEFYKYSHDKEISETDLFYRKIAIFTNLELREARLIPLKDLKEVNDLIDKAINTNVDFKSTFILDGKEFGFIPNFDKLTSAEWVDLMQYQTDELKLNYIMAILFRPITKKDKLGNYTIEKYKGTEQYKEKMLDVPFHIVKGGLGFFLNLRKELQDYIQKYTTQEQVKETTQ